jgi:hypothetical protein
VSFSQNHTLKATEAEGDMKGQSQVVEQSRLVSQQPLNLSEITLWNREKRHKTCLKS